VTRFAHPAIPVVLAAVLIDSIGFGIVLPVLPGLLVELSGASLADATRIGGTMLIAYAAAQFVAGPILGSLGDRFGRRPVLLASMLAFAADYALMAFAPSVAWLFAGRVIAGITGATYGPANAVIADVTPADRRGASFGLIGAAFGMGFVLGPALGGLLTGLGTRAPFMVAAGLALANAAAMALLLPETLKPENHRPFSWARANALGAFRPLFQAGNATPLLLAALLWQVAHMVYPATWAFWAEIRLGWDAQAIGWSLAASGLAMAVAQVAIVGRVIKLLGEERTVLVGLVIGGAEFVAYAFVDQGWQVYALVAVGALQGLVFPSLNALLSRMADASNQGALQGGMASLGSIAAVLGPLLMSQALASGSERGVPGANFLLAAAFAGAALLVVWTGVIGRLPRPGTARSTP
jgi:MFS transporter, DHA1 family, tetracycline resistance protein